MTALFFVIIGQISFVITATVVIYNKVKQGN